MNSGLVRIWEEVVLANDFNFALEHTIKKMEKDQELQFIRIQQLLINIDDGKLLGETYTK